MNVYVREYATLEAIFWVVMLALSIHFAYGAVEKPAALAICLIAVIQLALTVALVAASHG